MTERTGSSSRVRVAILGAGGIAETHAAILKSIPEVQLLAVCDAVPARAKDFQQRLGIPQSYGSVAELLATAKPDVIHNTTPPSAHASTTIACLDGGSHVFVEKPFCISSAECDQVAAAVARSGRVVGVNHNLTFHPSLLRMIDLIQAGRFGAVEHVTIGYNMPLPQLASGPYSHWLFRSTENLIFELAPHPLSIVERLLGSVLACKTLPSGAKILPSGVTFYSKWQIAMECERGTAQLFLSVAAGFQDTWVRVQGEDGTGEVNFRRNTLTISEKSHFTRPEDDLRTALRQAKGLAKDGIRNYKDYVLSAIGRPVPYPASYAAMSGSIRAFYAALGRNKRPPAGLSQGVDVVRACEMTAAPVMQTVEVNQAI